MADPEKSPAPAPATEPSTVPAALRPISYAEFGHNFVRLVVSAQRVRGEIEAVLESSILGTVTKLPADLVVASYEFLLRDVDVASRHDRLPEVSFELKLQGELHLKVSIVNIRADFSLAVAISIDMDVRTCDPLILKLEPHPVSQDSVHLEVNPHNVPAEFLERLRIIAPIVRDEIVREVNQRITSPELSAATVIDVLKMAEEAALTARPAAPEGALAEAHGSLPAAAEAMAHAAG